MAEKEEIILDLKIDQGSAISELEKTKKSIIQTKEELNQLTKAYKAGDVTLEEYASDSVRLEGILKKQQSTYNNVQKSVTGVKTQLDKLIDSNKKISASFQEAANNINVAGVNVGQLGNQLKSLTGPAGVITGAVAVVGALGAAYARSTVGAKDLEFAQNQLGIATGLLANKFSDLVNVSNEDGEGFLTQVVNAFLFRIDSSLAVQSKVLALIRQQVEDLQRAEIAARATVSDRLADNQELLTQVQDSQTSYNDKLHLTFEMIQNISKNEDDLLAIKNKQLQFAEKQLAADTENEDKQKIVLEINREISNIQKDAERRRQGILRLESNITDQYNKQLEAQKKAAADQEEERRKTLRSDVEKRGAGGSSISDIANARGTAKLDAKLAAQQVKMAEQTEEQKREAAYKTYLFKQQLAEQELAMTASLLGQASALFSEQTALGKTLGIANATVNTYQGATLALASLPPPFSFIQAALTIATGLASVAKITGVAAAGGADFTTKGPTMLLVGDNPGGREHVTVKPLSGRGKTRSFGKNGIAAAGGADFIADGGASKNAAVSETNQTILFANALKAMPEPVVSWTEGERVGKRVRIKQQLSKVGGRA